jgi:hypothetical protein
METQIIAAIYTRKSSSRDAVADEAKSGRSARRTRHCLRYVEGLDRRRTSPAPSSRPTRTSSPSSRARLSPAFFEFILNTVYAPNTVDRLALDAKRQELEAAGRQPHHSHQTRRTDSGARGRAETHEPPARDVRCLLEPREQQDRERLPLSLGAACRGMKQILRENPAQVRQVLKHVIGPIMLWIGEASDLDVADGYDPNERRGKENIEMARHPLGGRRAARWLPRRPGCPMRMARPAGLEPATPVRKAGAMSTLRHWALPRCCHDEGRFVRIAEDAG